MPRLWNPSPCLMRWTTCRQGQVMQASITYDPKYLLAADRYLTVLQGDHRKLH